MNYWYVRNTSCSVLHANNSKTWISEIRDLKVLILIVLIVSNWVQALLDARLV